jgi:hypothetical protein
VSRQGLMGVIAQPLLPNALLGAAVQSSLGLLTVLWRQRRARRVWSSGCAISACYGAFQHQSISNVSNTLVTSQQGYLNFTQRSDCRFTITPIAQWLTPRHLVCLQRQLLPMPRPSLLSILSPAPWNRHFCSWRYVHHLPILDSECSSFDRVSFRR